MPNGLFKYFGTDEDKLERFKNGQIYLTPPKYFNDPWDFLFRYEPYTEETLPPGFGFMRKDGASADFLMGESSELHNGLSSLVGVICLAEDPLDRLMWAHYGESHKGFVAEFWHSDEGTSESGFRLCRSPFESALKVAYQPTQPVLKRDLSNMEEVVLTKHSDWKHEKEWRVIRALGSGDPHPKRMGFVLIWFKPTHLLRVIFGLAVSPKVKFQLKLMLNHKEFEHVRMEEAYIDPSSRELRARLASW